MKSLHVCELSTKKNITGTLPIWLRNYWWEKHLTNVNLRETTSPGCTCQLSPHGLFLASLRRRRPALPSELHHPSPLVPEAALYAQLQPEGSALEENNKKPICIHEYRNMHLHNADININVHTSTHEYLCTQVYIHMPTHGYTHTLYTYAHIYLTIYSNIYTYSNIDLHIYICIYRWVCICITHTCMHIFIQTLHAYRCTQI